MFVNSGCVGTIIVVGIMIKKKKDKEKQEQLIQMQDQEVQANHQPCEYEEMQKENENP